MRFLQLALFLVSFSSAVLAQESQIGQSLHVEVREAKLRSAPNHFSKVTSSLAYGDALTVLESQRQWYRVRDPKGEEGFIHLSATTSRQVVVEGISGRADFKADSTDVVLAGKGFNPDIESNFRSQRSDLDYSAVDRVEAFEVSASELEKFMQLGGLSLKEEPSDTGDLAAKG